MGTVTVTINDQDYNLKAQENEEYLKKIALFVDGKIHSIMENNSSLSVSSAVVLASLNAADEMFKFKDKYEALLTREEEFKQKEREFTSMINSQEEQISELVKEREILEHTAQKYIEECTKLKSSNKELKFQSQSDRYKILDLEQKLIGNQIDLVKERKQNKGFNNKR